MLRWLQIATTDPYLKTVIISTYYKSLPYTLEIKFSAVPSAVLTLNFVWCYSRALVNVRYIIGRNKTSKSREMTFDIEQMSFTLKYGTFCNYPIQQSNITVINLPKKSPTLQRMRLVVRHGRQNTNNLHCSVQAKTFIG